MLMKSSRENRGKKLTLRDNHFTECQELGVFFAKFRIAVQAGMLGS